MEIRIIPYIVDGEENKKLSNNDLNICRIAIDNMKTQSKKDRLFNNYNQYLKLDTMAMYCVAVDKNKPVMCTGAQHISKHCCRLFSRYYLFDDYRTSHVSNLYDKVDNFQTDLYMQHALKNKYKLFFWSRDKGTGFFKKIKNARPDIFKNWTVYDTMIELLWKDNFQGIIYTGDITYIDELTINK
jgi:hypothetical protein|tara:strand:+ start:1898 stop:2452 length:555 start_codon:yes stop_codon:yes gene_type:complete